MTDHQRGIVRVVLALAVGFCGIVLLVGPGSLEALKGIYVALLLAAVALLI